MKVAQLCPDSLRSHGIVHGILQARILEWAAVPFSRGSSQLRDQTQQILHQLSHKGTPVFLGFPRSPVGKESAFNEGDLGYIPGFGRSPEEGKGHPLQYSGLENSMDYTVHWGCKEWEREMTANEQKGSFCDNRDIINSIVVICATLYIYGKSLNEFHGV